MYDSRLIGTWKSDAQRVAREILARRDIPTSKKRKLRSLFGKLELTFTRTHCQSHLEGHRTIYRYNVVAKDSSSVAIVSSHPIALPFKMNKENLRPRNRMGAHDCDTT